MKRLLTVVFVIIMLTSCTQKETIKYTEIPVKIEKKKEPKKIQITKKTFLVTHKTVKLFTRRYGKNALKRLNYINKIIADLQNASTYQKVITINKLINRIHFSPDHIHWKKENYWGTPLETIGTNQGDTEDISLLKYILMIKVGLNQNDIQLIKKDISFLRRNKEYKENFSLLYFTKKQINPLVIDFDFRGEKIYKYENQFKYEVIQSSPNKKWDVLFNKNLKVSELDTILNFLEKKK